MARKFSSYGPIDTDEHYYAPRENLIEQALSQLVGDNPDKGGHYFTVWAPRQTGKTWILNQALHRLKTDARFYSVKVSMESLKMSEDALYVAEKIVHAVNKEWNLALPVISEMRRFPELFTHQYLDRPLILILDEFDALSETVINTIVSFLRDMYIARQEEFDRVSADKEYLLHGVALIGVRAVLGIGNVKGSPFNIQRSLHIPNLTQAEVSGMFAWRQRESGQPGLTCWFGELLTETYNEAPDQPLDMKRFNYAWSCAQDILPNNNIMNLISKAREEPFRSEALKLFQTGEKIFFKFNDPVHGYLYTNGIVDIEAVLDSDSIVNHYCRFSCPFVQKQLFSAFSRELFRDMGVLAQPGVDLGGLFVEGRLNFGKVIELYRHYLAANREWLFRDVPLRKDGRPYEAVCHFNFFQFLFGFLKDYGYRVVPEFPTGNGQVDILIEREGERLAAEIKSYRSEPQYQAALAQAARYASSLRLERIELVVYLNSRAPEPFVRGLEQPWRDAASGVTVQPHVLEIL